LLFKITKLY